MLTVLAIRDFAIIDALELTLRPGLTVLTGETGAGKSILVDALQLLAGARAGAEMVRHGAERADLSATFDVRGAPAELAEWLAQQALGGDELIVRRMLGVDGRSRAWLNGQPVPLQLLREAGSLLIDIHGQHEFQSLTRATRQRELLDEYGGLEPLAAEVAAAWRRWRELQSHVAARADAARDRIARLDLLRHQAGELAALELAAGEFERLSEERVRLAHRGRLADSAQGALALLYQDETHNAHSGVGRALQALRAVAGIDAQLAPIIALAQEAEVNIREAARELELEVRFFQTNHEGKFVEHLHRLAGLSDAIVLNPGAWTHYSYAIRDALELTGLPAVEVHLSDVDVREQWRRRSVIAELCVARIAGKGPDGYRDALTILREELTR